MSDVRSSWSPSALVGRVSRLEVVVALGVVALLVVLVVLEPGILEAPFENWRTLAFTIGGTFLAGVVLVAMLRIGVPPVVRVVVLVVPFLVVGWWLISPFFVDEHVDDEFAVSIADAATTTTSEATTTTAETSTTAPPTTVPPTTVPPTTVPPTTPQPRGPVLLGSGTLRGLAGHRGSGVAGVFALDDGSRVLRLEGIDIQNGPDLHLYVVPGLGRTDPVEGSLYLGRLRGNVGNLTYDLPTDTVGTGDWTVLVWCDAFSVEFVGADLVVL